MNERLGKLFQSQDQHGSNKKKLRKNSSHNQDPARPKGTTHKPIKIWARNSTILPNFVGLTLKIHNGRGFTNVKISQDMVGHKFGEFSFTRQIRPKHKT